jgi:hypothetical protein
MDAVNNQDLQLAYDFVRYTNRNIFLTGKAGTGKTTFLRDLKLSSPKRLVVVAPTGVAAINAGGVTIHSFFQLPFHPYLPAFYTTGKDSPESDAKNEPPGYKMSREKVNIIRSLDLLIIDEISMVRADVLDAIDSALRRYKARNLPFGGVQLLMIGDLQQLAPVVKDDEREILGKYYDTFFFFGSKALQSTDYVTIELKHIYRQSDEAFIGLLNKIRDGLVDQETLTMLNKRYIPDFDPDTGDGYIVLTTHNNQARTINDSKLQKLKGRPHVFTATIKDEFPEFSYPNDNELILKTGAQVMFIKNDISGEKRFFNGKIGKVISFEEDLIVVECTDDESPIMVEKTEWQNMKYTLNDDTKEIEETVIGTFTQYPLRLAWAITIHKSQGLTFERAVIDAQSAFAHGQVYVALSRCRNLDGLVLSSRISHRSIIDNPYVTGFINESVKKQPGPKQLEESKKAYREQLISGLFSFTSIESRLKYCKKLLAEHSESILGNPVEMLGNIEGVISSDLIEVSEKFQPQLKSLLNKSGFESDEFLQERIKKAAVYFSQKLEAGLKEILEGFQVETDNRAVRKAVREAFERARTEAFVKLACLNAVTQGFDTGTYLEARAKAELEIPVVSSRQPEETTTRDKAIINPVLFRMLKEWRNAVAMEADLPHYMIIPQRTMVALANSMPRSTSALKQVKGMGKKKSQKFGEEILEIINTYCISENICPEDDNSEEEKKPKKKKEDTKKISYNMFKEGRTISQIAEERQLSPVTVEGHLAHFVGTGEIELGDVVEQEKAELIVSCIEEIEEMRAGPVKEVLGDQVSWSDIKFVINHLTYLEKIAKDAQ